MLCLLALTLLAVSVSGQNLAEVILAKNLTTLATLAESAGLLPDFQQDLCKLSSLLILYILC